MKEKTLNGVCLGVNILATASQADEVLRYIQLALSILSTLIILAFNLYKWWKKAKEDGKIDKEELQEGLNIVQNGLNEIKETKENEQNKRPN